MGYEIVFSVFFKGLGTVTSTTKNKEVRMFVGHRLIDDWLDCGYPLGKSDIPTFGFGGFKVDPKDYRACKIEEIKAILTDYSLELRTKTSLLNHR